MGKQPISNTSPVTQAPTPLKTTPKKVFFQVTSEYGARTELRDLLSKMIDAMALNPADIAIGEDLQPAQVTVRLLGGTHLGQTQAGEIVTHTLESLQQNASLKREAWAHLKQALTLLKS